MSDVQYDPTREIYLDYDKIVSESAIAGNPRWLVCLTDEMLFILLSVIRVAEWSNTRWVTGNKDEIDALVSETEYNLMSGICMDDLIRTQRMIVAAMVGEAVNLDDPLPASVDYTTTGIGPRLAAVEQTTDELEEIMEAVNLVLGGLAVLP